MEKQISAVERLVEQLKKMDTKHFNRLIQIEMCRENFEEVFEQAKEMEEQEKSKEYLRGFEDGEKYMKIKHNF